MTGKNQNKYIQEDISIFNDNNPLPTTSIHTSQAST